MEAAQLIAYLIAAGMAALALGFGWQQRETLRRLRGQVEVSAEERAYLHTQAWLRLACCAFMLVLAGLVAGAYASGMEARAADLGKSLQAQRERGVEQPVLTPDEQTFRKFYGGYWIGVLLLLLLTVILASADIWLIRRFHRRTMRKLDAARREMIEEQVAVLRSRRNGHVG